MEPLVAEDPVIASPDEFPLPIVEEPLAAVAAPAATAPATVVMAETAPPPKAEHTYPSLYDEKSTTVVAIILAMAILGGIQFAVARMFSKARDEYAALTQFVLSMVGLIIGAYLVDLIISGPDTSLLSPSEKATILDFIKTTCGLVFGYYFGSRTTKSEGEA